MTFEQHKRGFIEYSIRTDEILSRLWFPKYIYCVKTLYGDAAELLLEEVLQRGQVQMSKVIEGVMLRFNEALETSGYILNHIMDNFVLYCFSLTFSICVSMIYLISFFSSRKTKNLWKFCGWKIYQFGEDTFSTKMFGPNKVRVKQSNWSWG